MRLIALALLVVLFVGCGSQATLDCTSEATFKQSLEAMAKQLPEDQKPKLAAAMMKLSVGPIMKAALSRQGGEPEMSVILKDCHGMNAQQLIDKAGELKPSGDKSPAVSVNAPKPAELPATPAPAKVEKWTLAGEPIVIDGIKVVIDEVELGKVALQKSGNRKGNSTGVRLAIWTTITNTTDKRKVDFEAWNPELEFRRTVTLSDDAGNSYKPVNFGVGTVVQGTSGEDSIYPGKSVRDCVVFEAPVDGVQTLKLTLPASAIGGEGDLRFEIPASLIVRKPE